MLGLMGMGRPPKFTEALQEKMLELYKQGATDEQVADAVGVTARAIHIWKGKNPDFFHALKNTKSIADDLVEASLFNRAIGYSHPEEKVFVDKYGKVTRVMTTKHYPPDVVAQIFWLKNRQPDRWRTKDPDAMDVPNQTKQIEAKKKTFEQFCIDAKYPKPFPKQIEMVEFSLNGNEPRLMLGARGIGKTEYITILGVAYLVYLDPENFSALIISKSKTRNTAIIYEIAKALKENGITLEKENSNLVRTANLKGKDHSVEVLTIKSTFRGRHPKKIFMDDPVTEEDTSEATRKLAERKYNEAFKLTNDICIVGQPAHQHDLYAKIRGLVKKMEIPHGSIPELDHDLEAQRLAGVDEKSIQASYFLNIISDGSAPFEKIRKLDLFPHGDSVAFIDPSFEGGDYTALSIVRSYMDGVAVVGFVWKKAWNHALDDIASKLQKYHVRKLCFETNALGDMPIEILRKTFGQIGVVGKKSNTNKHSRIMAAGSYAHMIHLSRESDKTYQDHVIQYEYKAKFDDAPDSLASCLEWIGLIRGKL